MVELKQASVDLPSPFDVSRRTTDMTSHDLGLPDSTGLVTVFLLFDGG
jgi:hypothetical protein